MFLYFNTNDRSTGRGFEFVISSIRKGILMILYTPEVFKNIVKKISSPVKIMHIW